LVIRLEDGRLFAIGMGEHDRNMNPNPLLVTIDGPVEPYSPLTYNLSPNGFIKKGHHRVFLSNPDCEHRIDENPYGLYEVVLHQGEAYLLPWKGLAHLPGDIRQQAEVEKKLNIVDYSVGWQHELIVLK
jgi:hypothetical protein